MVNLSEELEINDDLSLCFFYTYLLYNGDLSINKEFKYSADNIYNDYFYQIMLGYDCYRNIEDGLRNFLNKKILKTIELILILILLR